MQRRSFLKFLVSFIYFSLFTPKIKASKFNAPIGQWILIANNQNQAFAWLLQTNGDYTNPYFLSKWIGKLRLSGTGFTRYLEINAETFEEAKIKLIETNSTWFKCAEDYTPGPWSEGSELAKNLGWNPNWKNRYF